MPLSAPGKFKTQEVRNSLGGSGAGGNLSTAQDCVLIGANAGSALDVGNDNTMIGSGSGQSTLNGSSNTFIGKGSGATNISGDSNLFLGSDAGASADTIDELTVIGVQAASAFVNGARLTAVGFNAGGNIKDCNDATLIGHNVASKLGTGGNNYPENATVIGSGAQCGTWGSDNNTIIGAKACEFMGTSNGNVAIGVSALANVNNGNEHVVIGWLAGTNITSGRYNTLIGAQAGSSLTTYGYNVGVGYSALKGATSAQYNVGVGYLAGGDMNVGDYNVMIGPLSGRFVGGGLYNSFLGFESGSGITGNRNVILGGQDALPAQPDVNNCVIIGHNTQRSLDDVLSISNPTRNTAAKFPLINGDFAGDNIGFNTREYGSGEGVFSIADATTAPSVNHTAGGYLYSEVGALKWRGSGGAITTLGPASAGDFSAFEGLLIGDGATDPGWDTTGGKVIVQLGDKIAIATTPTTMSLTNNAYYDGASYRRIAAGEATRYIQRETGEHAFQVTPTGVADSTTSWITALTIDVLGNLITNLPASAAGLPSGALWKNGSVVTVA